MLSTSVGNHYIISLYLNRVFCACCLLYGTNLIDRSVIIVEGIISTCCGCSWGISYWCPGSFDCIYINL